MYFRNRLLSSLLTSVSVAAVAAVSDAETLAGSETDALAIVYTDDYHKATSGFNGSVFCVDSGTPANDYSNSPTTEASSYFTYTSPSPKMILHDDGVLKYNAHNIITYSDQLDNAAWTKARCTISANATTDSNGDNLADKIVENTDTNSHGAIWQSSFAVSGAQYYIAADLKAAERSIAIFEVNGTPFGTSAYFYINLSTGTLTGTTSGTPQPANKTITDLGDGWYRLSMTVTASAAGTAGIGIYTSTGDGVASYTGDGSSGIYASRVQITRYPADTTYLKTTSSARYADPIEFNSSGTSLGLLVEPQRTNLTSRSADITNATTWPTQSNITFSANSTNAPNGLAQADLMIADATNSFHRIADSTSQSAGTYTSSMYAKAGGYGYAAGRLSVDSFGKYQTVVVDLSDGSVTDTTSSGTPTASWRVSTVGSGWYRIEITVAHTSGNVSQNWCVSNSGTPSYSSGMPSFSGDAASGVYFWGAQLEAGSSATSPIETYGSTVTRAADNISKATSGFAYSTSTGTLYVRYTPINPTASAHVINISDASTNRVIELYELNSTQLRTFSGQSTPATAATIAAGTECLAAAVYGLNDYEFVVDGTVIYTDTATTAIPTSPGNLRVGNLNGSSQLHGYIKAILYTDRRVSQADMQTLTSTGALP